MAKVFSSHVGIRQDITEAAASTYQGSIINFAELMCSALDLVFSEAPKEVKDKWYRKREQKTDEILIHVPVELDLAEVEVSSKEEPVEESDETDAGTSEDPSPEKAEPKAPRGKGSKKSKGKE